MDCTIKCDCKIANHKHGTRLMYVVHKCRGSACREASRVYESKRRRQRLYGVEAERVDAAPVRAHIKMLRANGLGTRRIAELSGVSRSAITAMFSGRRERGHAPYARVSIGNAERILAVRPVADSLAGSARVSSIGSIRRMRALVAIGHSITSIGNRIGVSPGNMYMLMRRDHVTAETARKVAALYEELWDKPNTSTEWQLLGSATRARNYATIHGWLPPMAWDDDQIDNPDYMPILGQDPGSKIGAKREAFIEESEFFAKAGENLESLSRGIGVSVEAIEKRLNRFGRMDLLHVLKQASPARYTA